MVLLQYEYADADWDDCSVLGFVTLVTFIWPFSFMSKLRFHKITVLCTHHTECFFSSMNMLMQNEMTALGECFVTFIWPFSHRNRFVHKITTVCKFLVTLIRVKWCFSCANIFLLNEATMRESPITMITNIWHFLRHKTTVFGGECSVALVTFVRLTHWTLRRQIIVTFKRNCKKNRRDTPGGDKGSTCGKKLFHWKFITWHNKLSCTSQLSVSVGPLCGEWGIPQYLCMCKCHSSIPENLFYMYITPGWSTPTWIRQIGADSRSPGSRGSHLNNIFSNR
jgi:hypothetical protein